MSNNKKRQKLALTSSSTVVVDTLSGDSPMVLTPDNVMTAIRLILTCQATSDEKISILMALTRCEPPNQEQKVQVLVPRSLTQSVQKGDLKLPVVTKKEAAWRPDPEEVPTLLAEETTFSKPLGKRKSMELTKEEPDSGDGKINVADKLTELTKLTKVPEEISDSQSQAF